MNKTQVYYEDVEIDSTVPSLVKQPTSRQMVMWAGVSGDYYEIHYDRKFALKLGLPDILVQGGLVASFLGQMITDWIGEHGILKKLQTVNKQMMFPNQDIICTGRAVKKYVAGGNNLVECEIKAEDSKGNDLVVGNAIVSLPSH